MLIGIIIFVTVFILLYLYAIMPKMRHKPRMEEFAKWLYAHRGLHNNKSEAPENSLKAFCLAVENHYGIELDVQLTLDEVPIILHDYSLKRPCGINKKVAEVTYEELQQYRLFQSEEKIPTFVEVLSCVDGKVPLIIELKIPWSAKRTCEIVSKILENYHGMYCIESFNPFGVIWYRKNHPEVIRGQLSSDFNKEKMDGSKVQYFILKHLLLNFQTKPDFIAYHYIYKQCLSITLCKKLFKVNTAAWTIQSQKAFDDNKNWFDLIIFDSFIPEDNK
jgi:glycerophosphoryl diester phosphodiesterase